MNTFKNLVTGVSLVAMLATAVPATAQVVPGGGRMSTPATSVPITTPSNSGSTSDFVMLSEMTPVGGFPRSATRGNIAEDTPQISRENFLKRYPESGNAGFERIRGANKSLCDSAEDFMSEIFKLDEDFKSSDQEFAVMGSIYDALPGDIRRATKVMTITQAGATGALCILSGGLYCIAAVLIGVGNLFMNAANRKLMLANIRLSVANIRLTLHNIRSNRLTLRMDEFWVKLVTPYCIQQFGAGSLNSGDVQNTNQARVLEALPSRNDQPIQLYPNGSGPNRNEF